MAAGSLRKGGDLWRSDYCLLRCTAACPREDGDRMESDSIGNQRKLLEAYTKIILSW